MKLCVAEKLMLVQSRRRMTEQEDEMFSDWGVCLVWFLLCHVGYCGCVWFLGLFVLRCTNYAFRRLLNQKKE